MSGLTSVSDTQLESLRVAAERMVKMNSPAVDEAFWKSLFSAITELQERRKHSRAESVPAVA